MTDLEAKEENYPSIAGLEHVYLEDSYVISLLFDKAALRFELLLVLTEDHEAYSAPNSGEQYCYIRNAVLSFKNPLEVEWISISMRPTTDVNNSIDFGNIDFLSFVGNRYYMAGDWGEVRFLCDAVELDVKRPSE